ncbi:MAG: hypothetical protein PHP58_07285 [Eubacteriales bacterium]|nr:hypothetical protein [Eubacteriales bacterium]
MGLLSDTGTYTVRIGDEGRYHNDSVLQLSYIPSTYTDAEIKALYNKILAVMAEM